MTTTTLPSSTSPPSSSTVLPAQDTSTTVTTLVEIGAGRVRASAPALTDSVAIDRAVASLTPRSTTTTAPPTTTTQATTTTVTEEEIDEAARELAAVDQTPDPDLRRESVTTVTNPPRRVPRPAPAPTTTAAPAPPPTQPPRTTQPVQSTTTAAQSVGVLGGSPTPASGAARVAHVSVPRVSVYSQPLAQVAPSLAAVTFSNKTQFGSPTTFLVTATQGDWTQVLLPMRQAGTVGWVHNSEIQVQTNNFRAHVDLSDHHVQVFNGGALIAETGVVTGKASRPTPRGRFFLTDKLRHQNPNGVYGPWILATSARSQTLTSFNGGEPIIALHGTNKPSLIGGSYSSGCIRMPNHVISFLAEQLPLGTPIDIVA